MYFYTQQSNTQVCPKNIEKNKWFDNWGLFGMLFGIPLVLFGIILSIFEILRIFYGPLQRGISNFNFERKRLLIHFC